MAEKRDSFGWAVGGWGGSEFDVHTRANYEGDDALARKVYAGAAHEEGVMHPTCDGAVRRLTPKLDTAVWYALIDPRAAARCCKPDTPGLSPILSTPEPSGPRDPPLREGGQAVGRLIQELRKHPPRPRRRESRMSLYAIDSRDGKVTLVAAEPKAGLDQCGSPSWTRDGKRILFDAQPRNSLAETRLEADRPGPLRVSR